MSDFGPYGSQAEADAAYSAWVKSWEKKADDLMQRVFNAADRGEDVREVAQAIYRIKWSRLYGLRQADAIS